MRNGEPFRVILGFESDWLIGTGRNQPAGLDEVTARDAEGLPYVPGTTAIGMVRDGTESVTYAFDGGQRHGPWRRWVDAMFGGQADGPSHRARAVCRPGPFAYHRPSVTCCGPTTLPRIARTASRIRGRCYAVRWW